MNRTEALATLDRLETSYSGCPVLLTIYYSVAQHAATLSTEDARRWVVGLFRAQVLGVFIQPRRGFSIERWPIEPERFAEVRRERWRRTMRERYGADSVG